MSNTNLRVVARLCAYPDKIEELKTLLLGLLEPTHQEAGCVQYDLLQNLDNPTDFTFVEEWESEAALASHLASAHIQTALHQVQGLVASGPNIERYQLLG
ncbi:antibiotic biosynthesis monooxygenase [Oscillatoria sp. FACHB-1406]|uniref:putative quinol monooxygenase n=1 Tax=Oscillatoria sp. FACHB-1406 TaxID=2692846 RepID=UPI001684A1B9|nr:antibiotic biosynthesis monooxygenase [Oscillatoria sp. FACHB-1406]MBD2576698.1 antibiotic biosynthesis monooxygenase [Oscillatoria sp. FACHB-1406]